MLWCCDRHRFVATFMDTIHFRFSFPVCKYFLPVCDADAKLLDIGSDSPFVVSCVIRDVHGALSRTVRRIVRPHKQKYKTRTVWRTLHQTVWNTYVHVVRQSARVNGILSYIPIEKVLVISKPIFLAHSFMFCKYFRSESNSFNASNIGLGAKAPYLHG